MTTSENRPVKVASLNLYHWAEPGVGWYVSSAAHDEASWARKNAWLRTVLADMDAEAIGFQEVVSVEALAALGRDAGWPHCAVVAEPQIETIAGADGVRRRAYQRPVNAILTRSPARVSELTPEPGLAQALGLRDGRGLRRPPVVVETTLGALGPATIVCAHLKSPGVSPGDTTMPGDVPATETGPEAARSLVEGLARAHGFATIQRVFEAACLQHFATRRIAERPGEPVILLGDFNDAPDSPPLRAMTAHRAYEQDGGAPEPGETAPSARDLSADWRMIDAARLAPRDLESDVRRPTHRAGAQGRVLDYILVSPALHPWNPSRVGDVAGFTVHDGWFTAPHPAMCSDHAGVSVTLQPRR